VSGPYDFRPLRSLCYRTDLCLASIDGIVRDRGSYFVIDTPSNPSFWWGNFIIFNEAPGPDAAKRGHDASWIDTFERELPGRPCTLIAWDRPDGELGDANAFVREDDDPRFALDESAILTATSVTRSSRHNDDVRVEPLRSETSWQEAGRVLVNAFRERRAGSVAELEDFVDRQLRRYRAMQERHLGQWYGAYLGGRLAATLGLVRVEGHATDAIGRFQLVGTDPEFARKGVCSTLVHDVARLGLEEQRLATLVMAADAGYHAARVYESVGFRPTERLFALMRHHARGD
jgi:hypothetical protein